MDFWTPPLPKSLFFLGKNNNFHKITISGNLQKNVKNGAKKGAKIVPKSLQKSMRKKVRKKGVKKSASLRPAESAWVPGGL